MTANGKEYLKSIDRRLAVIEKEVSSLRVKIAGISAVVTLLILGVSKWLS